MVPAMDSVYVFSLDVELRILN